MKTVIYNTSDGSIVEIIDEAVEMTGLSTGKAYVKSEGAVGTETNISQLPDQIRPKRIICGEKISGDTETSLNDASTVSELKTVLQTIFFGD